MKLAIVNCAQVVTLAGPARPRVGPEMRRLGIVAPGGLLIRDGLIEQVGSTQEIEKFIDADCEVVDTDGRIVLPGFVDAHTHPVFAGTRVDEFEQRIEGATYQEIAGEALRRVVSSWWNHHDRSKVGLWFVA
jgi:imidazolonepropionase